jgi:quinolinate synthase
MTELRQMQDRVRHLASELNAVLLVHYYQTQDVQEVADHLGDSLELALQAARTDADVIVFAGVDFMAETAKLVNPDKTVLHPNVHAKCPMAAMVEPTALRRIKKLNPDVPVVSYVNTSAAVKAESDICCTSANAVAVVEHMGADRIIFVPDTNLGMYVANNLPHVQVIPWPGYCHVHQAIKVEDVLDLQEMYPDAETLIHPEATPMVLTLADHVGSTRSIVERVRVSKHEEFIIGTEEGLTHQLRKLRPEAEFHVVPPGICPNMKRITLSNILASLENMMTPVELDPDLISRARLPVDRMLEIGRTSR